MRKIVLFMTFALAACGGGDDKTPDATASASASAAPARHKGLDCAGFPDFVMLPEDAAVSTCDNGNAKAAHVSGTIVFETDLAPKDAIAFVKDHARKSGLPEGATGSDPASPMYTSNDTTTKRSILVATERQAAGGTKVTLNWGKENWDAPANASGGQRNSGGD